MGAMRRLVLVGGAFLLLTGRGWGSGFYVKPLNGIEGAPTQGDGGSVFYNPAAMGLILHPEVMVDFSLVVRKVEYSRGITYTYQEGRWLERETSSVKKGNLLNFLPVPYFAFVFPFKKARFGIGFSTPFGSSSEWDKGGAQVYQSEKGNIGTYFGTAAFSCEVWRNLFLGLGISYVRSIISSEKLYNLTKVTGGYPEDPFMDAELELNTFAGNSWNLSAGILYAHNSSLIAGFSYTSPLYIKNDGMIKITPVGETAKILMSERPAEAEGTVEATYPQTFKLSLDYFPFTRLRLRGYFEFVNWNQFDGFHFRFDKKTSPFISSEMEEEQDFRDAFAISLSSKWWWRKAIAFTGGVGFDRSAIKDTTVGADFFDSDKVFFTLGTEIGLGKGFFLRAGTQQVFFLSRDVKGSTRWPSANGKYEAYTGFFNLNIKWVRE